MSNTSPDTSLDLGSPSQEQQQRQQHEEGSPSALHDSSILTQSSIDQHDDTADTSELGLPAEKHPKGKRKRTATKDKMILEEAYLRNPKPDKQARLDVVQRVSLNEKEVQIWFQNRRQNDRRKSRPLSPQEIAALRFGHIHNMSTDSISSHNIHDAADSSVLSEQAPPTSAMASTPPGPLRIGSELSKHNSNQSGSHEVSASQESSGAQSEATARPAEQTSLSEARDDSQNMAHSFSSSVGYLANRWHLERSFSGSNDNDDSFRSQMFPSSDPSNSTSQAQMRLSLSLEGKAEVVSSAPSPVRPAPSRPISTTLPALPQVRQRSLQRSHSEHIRGAQSGITLPSFSTLTSSLGRSRDVQAWESCADAETRDELTTQAERESSGSAVAAISLLRSTSAVLQPSGSKRNSSLSRQPRPDQPKKAKLGRAYSSIARLETIAQQAQKAHNDDKSKGFPRLLSPNDSDKENWSPDEDGNPRPSQRSRQAPAKSLVGKSQNPRRLGRTLQVQGRPTLLAGRANTSPAVRGGSAKGIEIFDDGKRTSSTGQKQDNEVDHFMRGSVSPSKKGDMDCVAGLLSLSQGAWR